MWHHCDSPTAIVDGRINEPPPTGQALQCYSHSRGDIALDLYEPEPGHRSNLRTYMKGKPSWPCYTPAPPSMI
jgi:hypothetical protein